MNQTLSHSKAKSLKKHIKKGCFVFLIFLLLLPQFAFLFAGTVHAATSPWTQTDWSGGSGQTAWLDATKYDSASNMDTATAGQAKITSWAFRRKITFDNSAQATALTSFPVLVKLNSSRISYANTQNAGEDIRFTDSDGTTVLSYEIEKWNEAGDSFVWVKVPQIDASSSTDHIYMYYGNSSATDAQNKTAVWSSYTAVYHLSETGTGTSGEFKDSTSTFNGTGGAGTAANVPTVNIVGQIGNSQTFDGTDFVDMGDVMNFTSSFTLSSWFYCSTDATTGVLLGKRNVSSAGTQDLYTLFINPGANTCTGPLSFTLRTSNPAVRHTRITAANSTSAAWHNVTAVFDYAGQTMSTYFDGALSNGTLTNGTSFVTLNTGVTTPFRIGTEGNGQLASRFFTGNIDESRTSTDAKSAAWVAGTYLSETDAFNTFGSEEASTAAFTSPGTLTSSIFDTEFSAAWGNLTYTATTPSNTSVAIKVRSGNVSDMSDAIAFSSCTAVASGSDLSSNDCMDDTDRYVQYQAILSNTDGASNPTLQDVSIAFSIADTTGPSVDLDSPGNNAYTNNVRPTFKWKKATDEVSTVTDYDLVIDNPSLGSGQLSGDFTISDIPVSRTTPYETPKYVVTYDNFSDADSTNDYISVYTKQSVDWTESENHGELREGRVNWSVKVTDSAGNQSQTGRTLFVDRTIPSLESLKVNNTSLPASQNIYTTDSTPTFKGKIVDTLAGGDLSLTQDDNGPRVAAGPQTVTVKLEKRQGVTYNLYSVYTINTDKTYFSCTNALITDNSKQTCSKFSDFDYTTKEHLTPGIYRVTIQGKDKADNTKEITFLLRVNTGSSTPSFLPGGEDEPEEVTEPVETIDLTQEEKVQEQITEASRSIFDILAQVFAFMFDSVKDTATLLANSLNQTIALYVNFGNDVLVFASETFNTLGRNTSQQALSSSGFLKNILIALSKTAQTASLTIASVNQFARQSISSVAFILGERMQDVSDTAGNMIVKFGYIFVSEPTTIYDVKVAILSPTSAKVSWKTNHPANGKVNYGLDRTYPFDIQSEKRVTDHEFILTDLQPGTTYHFEVMSHNKNYVYDANREFTTPAN